MDTNYFVTRLEISPDLIEPIYQHVHHANIIRLLEIARLRFLNSLGFDHNWFLKHESFFVIASIEVRYLREVRGDAVSISCESPKVRGRSVFLDQRLILDDCTEAVTARVHSMLYSPVTRKSLKVPDEFMHAFNSLSASCSS